MLNIKTNRIIAPVGFAPNSVSFVFAGNNLLEALQSPKPQNQNSTLSRFSTNYHRTSSISALEYGYTSSTGPLIG